MDTIRIAGSRSAFATTERVDQWWMAPVFTALGLIVFFGYLTFRAFHPTYVWFDPYISPAVAPPLFTPASGYPGAVPVTLPTEKPLVLRRPWPSPSAPPAITIAAPIPRPSA